MARRRGGCRNGLADYLINALPVHFGRFALLISAGGTGDGTFRSLVVGRTAVTVAARDRRGVAHAAYEQPYQHACGPFPDAGSTYHV